MFQLLQPVWLFASTAILIPVIIHLWNIRQGKTLRIGSISLLQESARTQGRSLKLTDILLLILRCLLIIISAVLLSQPVWRKQLNATNEKGWVLLEKLQFSKTYQHYKPSIDSLLKAGYHLHYFEEPFEAVDLEKALSATSSGDTHNKAGYWQLLSQLNEIVPDGLRVCLFTDNKLQRFSGKRPVVSMNLKWNMYQADTMTKALALAYRSANDSLNLIVTNSHPEITYNERLLITDNDQRFRLENNGSQQYVQPIDTTIRSTSIQVNSAPTRLAIFADAGTRDASYLAAAVNAISQYTGLNIITTITGNSSAMPDSCDWLFWLSAQKLPAVLPKHVFAYAAGDVMSIYSVIRQTNAAALNQQAPHLSKRSRFDTRQIGIQSEWQDGFGQPLLTHELNKQEIYRFYSHFDPSWNDLPWSFSFAEMIYGILFKSDQPAAWDNRGIDPAMAMPVFAKSKSFDKENFVRKIDLQSYAWLLIAVLFLTERYISFTNKKTAVYGV